MKRKVVLAAAFGLTMSALSAGSVSAYTAGTYTGTAAGRNGDVTVEVTFTEDAIESINVTEHAETDGIGTNAVDQIPGAIVDAQSLGVEAVAGATVTSDAIVNAVADCVQQAGGDVEALKNVEVAEAVPTEEAALDTDLVIVGGGGAGMTAAIKAAEYGLDVVLVEKMSFMGGAISISGGNQVVSGSQMQKDLGVTDDSAESMVEDFMANGAGLNVPELINLYAENVGETSDWLQSIGVTFNLEGGLHSLAEYSHDRELAYEGSGAGAAENMRNLVAAAGTNVLLNTRATELISDGNGGVAGVIANDGTTVYTINADAVLLATGGYGYNKDLLQGDLANALYYGPVSSTGDGLLMATADGINADTRLLEYGKRYPNGIEVSEGIAKSTINGNLKIWNMASVLVNAEGERVVNEKASNRTILETELEQTNQELFLVMDQETFDVWAENVGYDVSEYLEANGSTTPVFGHGETIEAAAEAAGVNAEALAATIEKFNSYVEAGEDPDFGRAAEYLQKSFGDGEYYIVEQKPRFATTMGGLVIDTDLQVINTDGNVITGLYAAGEVVGGVMGDDSPSGANNGWAVTSGNLAAQSIAAFLGSAEEVDQAA
ncbi:MAG: FAD-dependent oxidoreductase [Eubacteriales bacterium]|nr:FAD-dependent oxidoreductase [Eubacteriales bacterium]